MSVLGHRSVSMSLVYAQISDPEVLRDYQAVLGPGATITGPCAAALKAGDLPGYSPCPKIVHACATSCCTVLTGRRADQAGAIAPASGAPVDFGDRSSPDLYAVLSWLAVHPERVHTLRDAVKDGRMDGLAVAGGAWQEMLV